MAESEVDFFDVSVWVNVLTNTAVRWRTKWRHRRIGITETKERDTPNGESDTIARTLASLKVRGPGARIPEEGAPPHVVLEGRRLCYNIGRTHKWSGDELFSNEGYLSLLAPRDRDGVVTLRDGRSPHILNFFDAETNQELEPSAVAKFAVSGSNRTFEDTVEVLRELISDQQIDGGFIQIILAYRLRETLGSFFEDLDFQRDNGLVADLLDRIAILLSEFLNEPDPWIAALCWPKGLSRTWAEAYYGLYIDFARSLHEKEGYNRPRVVRIFPKIDDEEILHAISLHKGLEDIGVHALVVDTSTIDNILTGDATGQRIRQPGDYFGAVSFVSNVRTAVFHHARTGDDFTFDAFHNEAKTKQWTRFLCSLIEENATDEPQLVDAAVRVKQSIG